MSKEYELTNSRLKGEVETLRAELLERDRAAKEDEENAAALRKDAIAYEQALGVIRRVLPALVRRTEDLVAQKGILKKEYEVLSEHFHHGQKMLAQSIKKVRKGEKRRSASTGKAAVDRSSCSLHYSETQVEESRLMETERTERAGDHEATELRSFAGAPRNEREALSEERLARRMKFRKAVIAVLACLRFVNLRRNEERVYGVPLKAVGSLLELCKGHQQLTESQAREMQQKMALVSIVPALETSPLLTDFISWEEGLGTSQSVL